MNKAAQRKHKQLPFLCEQFNMSSHTPNNAIRGIARLINPFIQAFNKEPHRLPKYVIMIPDQDLMRSIKPYRYYSSIIIGAVIHYLIKQIDLYINRRRIDIDDKKAGAALQDKYPKIVWIRMLKRPKYIKSDFFALRNKFNGILEDRIPDGTNHYIMSIDVPLNQYDLQGNLTAVGKESFWNEVNRGMKKFNNNEISLKPRLVMAGDRTLGIVPLQPTKTGEVTLCNPAVRRRLITPEPKERKSIDKSTEKRRSLSKGKRHHRRSHSHNRSGCDNTRNKNREDHHRQDHKHRRHNHSHRHRHGSHRSRR